MDSGEDGDWLLGGIDTGENVGSFKDTRKSLVDLLGRQMVQMKVDMVRVGSDTTSLEDLHGHGAGDNVTRSEILGSGGITLHETLTLAVSEDTTFTTATLSHEAASTIDTSWVELDELGIFNGKASSGDHTTTVTSAGVSTGAGEVGSAVATSGKDSLVSLHSVNGTIGHVVSHDTAALITVHEEIHGEVLHEEDAVVAESSSKESVQHAVAGSVGDSTASVGLATLAEVSGLTSEGSLVDLTLAGSAEGHTVGFKLSDSERSLSSHVLDGVLITKPVRALNCIIEVISPVISMHVTEGSIDTSLE